MAPMIRWRNKVVAPAAGAVDNPARPPACDRNPPATGSITAELAGTEAMTAGDGRSFQVLIERHQGPVYAYLRSRMLQHVDAEDLTQEVFLRAYIGRARFDGSVKVRPWLLGIARNVLYEYVRTSKRRKEVAWTELCLELEALAACHDESCQDDTLQQLPKCLASLGPTARQALEMHYQGRLRLAEIGAKMQRSPGAVKLLMFRARQAVKRCLDSKTSGRSHDGRGTD